MKKVIIIDDSAFARSKTRRILENHGYTVMEADSGEKGIELVRQDQPAAVTLDLLMPGMSGLETLQGLKTISPSLKVIVLSADIQVQTRQELMQNGADAFLNKPVSEADLLQTIVSLVKDAE